MGRAPAKAFAEAGAAVVLVDREEGNLRGTTEEIAAAGGSDRACMPSPRNVCGVRDPSENHMVVAAWRA